MTQESDLPQPPAALLDLLQRLDSKLDELDALRDDVRTLRQALQALEPRDATVSPPTIHAIASISATGVVTGTASSTFGFEAHAVGHSPTIEDQPTREWLTSLRKRGGQAAKAADVITRVIYIATKLGDVI